MNRLPSSIEITILYKLALIFTVLFYIIYSILPSLFSISSLITTDDIYFLPSLGFEDVIKIIGIQIAGLFVLLIALPRYNLLIQAGKVSIRPSAKIVSLLSFLLMIYTLPALLQMYFGSLSNSGRVDLFNLFSDISSTYKLNYVFLLLSVTSIYLVYYSNHFNGLIYLLPLIVMEVLALGRVWPYSYFVLLLFSFVFRFKKMPTFRQAAIILIIFLLYSLIRIETTSENIGIFGILIFMFGEAYNTQQTIDIVVTSDVRSTAFGAFTNLIFDYIPFGFKAVFGDVNSSVVALIDQGKNQLYGQESTMGYGSSWLAQFIIYFGLNWMAIFYPVVLSLSLRLFVVISRYSSMFGVVYLYFYISGLFIFYRYGFSLALSYPLTNLINVIVLLLCLTLFGTKKYHFVNDRL